MQALGRQAGYAVAGFSKGQSLAILQGPYGAEQANRAYSKNI
jgi:hypothetical protein